jgi:hypothetical protein
MFAISKSVLVVVIFPLLAVIIITLESLINSKSSVPTMEIDEPLGIAFVISSASPIALFFVEFTKIISSSDVNAARNPTAEPTLPAPIIDMIEFHLSLYY